ncbi:MAG: ATP-binding cassette domain-containing protein [Spirochaetes bacterium]|nr:ATP-binding cassette domain-containing protein [Spirochaetota bacterium]
MEHLVECRDVVKIHRGRGIGGAKHGFKAVEGISLSIDRDRSYGLVGESGCGKTTFARALLYLDPPTSGSIRFDGVELSTLGRREFRKFRKRMQIVFQDPNSALNPKMSIHDSLSEGLINRGIGEAERAKRIKDLLELVGISYAYRNRYPHEFSGGQKQRIVIARALSMEPDFLVLDEPVSNLDVSIQGQIINLLTDLKNEFSLTYLFISHDLNLVSYMCDTMGVMFKGKIVEEAASEILVSKPSHPYTRRLLASIPGGAERTGALGLDEEEESVETLAARAASRQAGVGCPYYPYCPLGDDECVSSAPSLRQLEGGHVVSCHKVEPAESR